MAEPYDVFASHSTPGSRHPGDRTTTSSCRGYWRRSPGTRHRWRRVSDLGIGTGDLVVALARAGYAVVGVDRSPAMLAVARAKVAAASPTPARAPVLVQQDLRALDLDAPVDAAVCVYTVINQLTGDGDLARALVSVHAALEPGGLFLSS